jgi:hypothetical protein
VHILPAPPAFTSGTLPGPAYVGISYSFAFTASGNPASAFSVTDGSLPPGLVLDDATGLLSGRPTATGTYTFTVTASNSVYPAATQEATIEVRAIVYLPLVLRQSED